MTIDEIAERLAVSRTSVYGWVRDLPFDSNTAKRSAAQRRAARANSKRAAERRREAYERGRLEYDGLITEPTFRDFLCLYWAEGYKRNRNVVALSNSDPRIIRVADRWMRRFASRPLAYAIQYHADQNRLELCRWWAAELEIDPAAIRSQRKSNSSQLAGRTWRSVHGVLAVSTGDTWFRARLQAWLDLVSAEWV